MLLESIVCIYCGKCVQHVSVVYGLPYKVAAMAAIDQQRDRGGWPAKYCGVCFAIPPSRMFIGYIMLHCQRWQVRWPFSCILATVVLCLTWHVFLFLIHAYCTEFQPNLTFCELVSGYLSSAPLKWLMWILSCSSTAAFFSPGTTTV